MQFDHFVLVENATLVSFEGKPVAAPREVVVPRLSQRDIHQAGGVGLLHAEKLGLGLDGQMAVRLTAPTQEQRLSGIVIVAQAREAARRHDAREVGLLVACFRHLVLRLPEVHAYLDGLPLPKAERIAGVRAGRGRPRDLAHELACVYTLDRLRERRCGSLAAAARELAPLVHLAPTRLRNLHAELWSYARIRADGFFVSGARTELTPLEWGQTPLMTVQLHHLR